MNESTKRIDLKEFTGEQYANYLRRFLYFDSNLRKPLRVSNYYDDAHKVFLKGQHVKRAELERFFAGNVSGIADRTVEYWKEIDYCPEVQIEIPGLTMAAVEFYRGLSVVYPTETPMISHFMEEWAQLTLARTVSGYATETVHGKNRLVPTYHRSTSYRNQLSHSLANELKMFKEWQGIHKNGHLR